MKNLIKRFVKALWKATGPVRRPVQRKLESYLSRVVGQIVHDHVTAALGQTPGGGRQSAYDTNLLLNSLVREVSRLQMQVEILQQYAEEAHQAQLGTAAGERTDHAYGPYNAQRAPAA